jgi:RNA recognition motif-containing protein
MEVKVYVGNLPDSMAEKDLRELFAQAGNVISVDLILDRHGGRSKDFAYVIMGTQAEAQKALSMFNAHSIDGHELSVKLAKPRQAAPVDSSSRLSAFAPAGRVMDARKPKAAPSGYQSRLSAFGQDKDAGVPRRRGGRKPR